MLTSVKSRIMEQKKPTEIGQYKQILETCQKNPVWFCREILGIKNIWSKMAEIMESVANNRQTVVKAGYSVSKSYTAACIAIWFLNVFKDSIVITTAPTATQVADILWAEIRQIYNNAKVPLGGRVLLTEIRKAEKWFAMGLSPKHDIKTEGVRFQGFHAPHILIIFDEAPGIADVFYDSVEGLMSSEHARWLCIGNPISDNDRFSKLFKTKGWVGHTISCLESPNVVQNRNVIPGMVTREWVEEKKAQWGEESSLYRTKVLGEFPFESSEVLIPLEYLLKAVDRKLPEWKMARPIISMGVDVARFGINETSFTLLKGRQEVYKENYQGKDTAHTLGKSMELIKRFNPDIIGVDDIGIGGFLCDNIPRQYPVIPFQGGGEPEDEKFKNLNAEAWWNVKEDFRIGEISILNDTDTIDQLNCRKYDYDEKGRIYVESKKELKKRGFSSLDRADSFVIAHWSSLHINLRNNYDEDEDERKNRTTNHSRTGY